MIPQPTDVETSSCREWLLPSEGTTLLKTISSVQHAPRASVWPLAHVGLLRALMCALISSTKDRRVLAQGVPESPSLVLRSMNDPPADGR